jgi:hypothetical protein
MASPTPLAHGDISSPVLAVQLAHPLQMDSQLLADRCWQHRASILDAFALAHGDLPDRRWKSTSCTRNRNASINRSPPPYSTPAISASTPSCCSSTALTSSTVCHGQAFANTITARSGCGPCRPLCSSWNHAFIHKPASACTLDGHPLCPHPQPRPRPPGAREHEPGQMKIVTVISYPRSGSTLLLQALDSYNITALLEIYHTNPLVAVKHLARDQSLLSTTDFIESYSRETATKDPVALINAIAQIKPESGALMFKIFPGHLPDQGITQIMSRSDMVLIHTRNRLHSFISDLIATRLGSWTRTRTDTHFVDFQPDSFIFYSRRIHNFLTSVVEMAIDSKTPIAFSSYEKLIKPSDRLSSIHAIAAITLDSKDIAPSTSGSLPRRQDNRLLASQKTTNPRQLLAFLAKHNMLTLDNGTSDIQFSQYSSLI